MGICCHKQKEHMEIVKATNIPRQNLKISNITEPSEPVEHIKPNVKESPVYKALVPGFY
jgi:hypothetical protein